MIKWLHNLFTLKKHNIFSWDEENISIHLKPNNPFNLSHISVCNTKYELDKSALFYKIMDKRSRSMLLAISVDLVESVTTHSDLTK